jgi:hypothetical protein
MPMRIANVVIALSTTAVAAADLPSCRVEALGMGLAGFAMNERGDVVGRRLDLVQVGHAFVVRAGATAIVNLPTPPPWISSDAYAISDTGVIVGAVSTASIASVGSRPAAWFPAKGGWRFTLLPTLPGDTHGAAFGVNDWGDIVGGSGGLGLGMYPRAALFTPAGATQLEGIGTPADVNDSRVVLAGNQLLDLDTLAITTVPLPPGNWQGVVSVDLNEAGGFCGHILGFSGCSNFPVRWMPDAGWTFVGGCATTTSATSLNDRGDTLHFVLSGGVAANLVPEGNVAIESMIDPSQGAWSVAGVGTINNARQMLVSARPPGSSVAQLVRLTPIVGPDLDGDGAVGASDLARLLAAWDTAAGDLDGDGLTGAADLAVLLAAWTG